MKRKNIINLVFSGMLVAIGVILPQIFHLFGTVAGSAFLPMHIPIILAGLIVGPAWGAGVAFIVPIISSVFTGMPPVPKLYFMIIELVIYAVVSGILAKKLNIYLNLIITMICGRLAYGLSLVLMVNVFGMTFKFANTAAFFGGIVNGLPGILIQLIFIPPIIYALKKGGYAVERTNRYAKKSY